MTSDLPKSNQRREFWLIYDSAYGDIFSEEKTNESDIHVREVLPTDDAVECAVDEMRKALENIKSVNKKNFEENPMYWAEKINVEANKALAAFEKAKGVK